MFYIHTVLHISQQEACYFLLTSLKAWFILDNDINVNYPSCLNLVNDFKAKIIETVFPDDPFHYFKGQSK